MEGMMMEGSEEGPLEVIGFQEKPSQLNNLLTSPMRIWKSYYSND
jgi:hypothetical protein